MMKRLTALILTLALALTLLVLPAAGAESYATATVKGGWLRLRAEANSDSETLSAYYTGTTVTILGGSGEWYHVLTPDGKTGYMYSGYLTITGSITGGQLDENTAASVYAANGKPVRLRSGPSTQYSIIASYAVGTPLTILSSGDEWCRVRINGRTGYMMTDFIKTDGTVQSGYTAYVVSANGKNCVLRSGPSKQYDVLASYAVGTKVTINSYGSTWSQITVNGLKGYMMSQYLSTTKPDTSSGSTSSSYTAYVTSSNGLGVRMRSGASKLFPTIATYNVGTKVTVLEYGSTWCKIRISGQTGYMMTEFLTTRAPSMVELTVKVNTASAVPGDTLYSQVTPTDASVSYAWINDRGVTLGTGSTYTVRQSDVDSKIRVSITGYNGTTGVDVSGWVYISSGYAESVYRLTGITISDTTPAVGQTLNATIKPSGATASISWFRENGVFVGSGSSYTVRSSDVGYRLYAQAQGTNATTGDVTSAYTSAVTVATTTKIVLQSVSISDTTPNVGQTLNAVVYPTNAEATFTWRCSDGRILGYGSTYTVTEEENGDSIYVYANGTGNTTGSVVSGLTSAVRSAATATVRIDGVSLSDLTPNVGQTLVATVNPSNASALITWYRDDDVILGYGSTYTVRTTDAGHCIYVWAEGSNGTFGSATSSITAPVSGGSGVTTLTNIP